MKKLVLSLFLLLLANHATAATLTRDGLVGSWVTPEPQGIASSIARWFSDPTGDRLEINGDLTVKLIRRMGRGKDQTLLASPSMVSFHGDLLIVKFPFGSGSAKLVLSGWRSQHGSKRLFGQLYLYDGSGLFDGIPISFEPVAGR